MIKLIFFASVSIKILFLPFTKLIIKWQLTIKEDIKTPKEKEVKEVNEEQQVIIDEKDSTTAGVFSKLDETASRTEDWVAKNQKIIIGLVAGIAVATIGYLAYQKFIEAPKQDEAANEMFVAQQNFQKAVDGVASDSLYKLVIKRF